LSGCRQSAGELVLSQTRDLPSGATWDRELVASRPGVATLEVSGQPPFRVTVVNDKGYKQMVEKGDSLEALSSGVLVNSPSDDRDFKIMFRAEKDSYWISITNKAGEKGSFSIKCYAK
jgi:hypothetical protein